MCLQHFEQLLLSLALKSPMTDKYAAVLVYRNKIIGAGYNNYSGQIRRMYNQCLL